MRYYNSIFKLSASGHREGALAFRGGGLPPGPLGYGSGRRTIAFTAILLFSSSVFFFIRQLLSELTERNSTTTGRIFGSECVLKMHVQHLGYYLPPKSEAQKPHIFDVFDDVATQ